VKPMLAALQQDPDVQGWAQLVHLHYRASSALTAPALATPPVFKYAKLAQGAPQGGWALVWIVLIGLGLGLLVGLAFPVVLPLDFTRYLSIALLAALDSVFGGIRGSLEGRFDPTTFVSGLISNAILAAGLTYLGDKLGVPLYYAALFALGFRLFQNLGAIRHLIQDRLQRRGREVPPAAS
jgi:small basic protein